MKTIKKLIKKFDLFGVPFSFRYQNEDKYSTSLGGLFSIAFCIVVVVFGFYYCIPFYNRKNFSIVYYSMNLPNTEQIKFRDAKSAFAFGLDCEESENGTKAENIFNLNIKYYTFRKDKEGNKIKTSEILNTHLCNYSDFYNIYNDSIDILGLNKYLCLDKIDSVIEGLYTDEIFTYYELSVKSKEKTINNFNLIDDYLTSNDCKLSVYFLDITIDIDKYEEPIQPFLNELFIQINPTLFSKMNAFFVNQYFENDNYLFSVLDERNPLSKISFSRAEQYSLYKGLNRGEKKLTNAKSYAKIFIRADTKKIIIKRKYQKIMEFFADFSSLLIALFDLLSFIFNFINSFYADYSFTKKLFFFKDVDDNHLNINKRHKQIKELINLTEPLSFKRSESKILLESSNKKLTLVKETKDSNTLKNEDLKIFNKDISKNMSDKEIGKLSIKKKLDNEIEIKGTNKIKIKKKKSTNLDIKSNREKEEIKNNDLILHKNPSRNDLFSGDLMNLESNLMVTRHIIPKLTEKANIIEESKIGKIKYSYNIFEIIISSFLCCFMTKNLKLKKNITEKANIILYNKLDIVLFVRNMILLDLMNDTLLNYNNNRKDIIKFLSRPIISINKNEENELNDFYKQYNENDFDNFYHETSELVLKSKGLEMEKKLITLSNYQLKELIYN